MTPARRRKGPAASAAKPAGYSGTPLPQKLGIKPGMAVALVDAPDGFERTLGALPEGATLRRAGRGRAELVIWFVRSAKDLTRGVATMAACVGGGGLWIAWPKLGSPLASDLRENLVRDAALAEGWVDYKVCAIDTDWSGLKFARRK
jgi:hypothetical protein